ncbi:MAG: zinc ribbon domain-containing protein [Candidatus Muirbacterium halophilum]|nr:zinc ribbon domain-containing protein [Candidatus Muirbacterium halophilum]
MFDDIFMDNDWNPLCQSCSLPLVHKDFCGTNLDNTLNHDYCRLCYLNGKFTSENITMQEIIKSSSLIFSVMKDYPYTKAEMIVSMLVPRLKRWRDISGYDKRLKNQLKSESRLYVKWFAIEERSLYFVIHIAGKGDFLFSRRLSITINEISEKLINIDEKNISAFYFKEINDLLDSMQVLFNLSMDKGYIFEKEFREIFDEINNFKKILSDLFRNKTI